MKKKRLLIKALAVFLALLLAGPLGVLAQSGGGEKTFKQEELDQLVAPIALYPDSLLTQILMASTYPLDVVEAARWVKANQKLKGDALTAALEKQKWDPSVKSLVNFPQVLDMMDEKLDWTQKLGDAFLAQQKDVMDTAQKLRLKAYGEGNLKTTKEQVVKVEQETIIIEPASPQVVYVPAYDPTVVYGGWPYPAYPPYSYYPPGYVAAGAAFSFMAGAAVGAAWGYAWGHANWQGGNVNVNVNQNANINNSINRSQYQNKVTSGQGGQGEWKHDPERRQGTPYRDQSTAQKYGRGGSQDAQSRDGYRGRDDGGRQASAEGRDAGSSDRGGAQQGRESGAFGGADRGSQTRESSSRGNQSLSSSRGGERGGGGMSHGGFGGGRGGGGRR